jgi:hypothetical protein
MMTAMLLALWVQNAGFTLRIQAVDSGWLPLAGVSFKVQSVGSCDRPPLASDPKPQEVRTSNDGWATLPARPDASYRILFENDGAYPVNKCVHLGVSDPPRPSAAVQIQIRVKIKAEGSVTDPPNWHVTAAFPSPRGSRF